MAMPLRTIGQPALLAWPKIPNSGEKSGLAYVIKFATIAASCSGFEQVIMGFYRVFQVY